MSEHRVDRVEIVEETHKGSRGIAIPPVPGAPTRFVDLSHTLREGIVTLPGVPAPELRSLLRRGEGAYAPGTSFAMDVFTIAGNTGTYLDTAWHRYEDGPDLAALELDTLVDLPTEVFHLTDLAERGIPANVFFDRDVRGKAVLLHTGWDRHFGSPAYGEPAPYLTAAGVDYLTEAGATLVGIDSVNIDDMSPEAAGERPAHTMFLAHGIHVVEHLTGLGALPPSGALFTAVPPKFEGTGTFTVRAYAKVPA